jgi:hypothetical protein
MTASDRTVRTAGLAGSLAGLALVAGTPVYVLFSIPLLPVAMTIAILAYRLLDIRVVVSRAMLYALLTALAIGAYLGLVVVFGRLLPHNACRGTAAAATVVIAVGFNPVRIRLQQLVDCLLYGDRADPVRAVTRVGARLATGMPFAARARRGGRRVGHHTCGATHDSPCLWRRSGR